MSKKLKIQFWKAEKALAMQILEQEGLPESRSDGVVNIDNFPWLDKGGIDLRGYDSKNDWVISTLTFKSNDERDAYLQKVVNAITEELFSGEEDLTVGELCEVRNKNDDEWRIRKLITILPEPYYSPYIVEAHEGRGCCWQAFDQARPISNPKIDGDVYTWEEK